MPLKNTLTASILILSVGGTLSSASFAAEPPPGRLLVAQCAQCHGTGGNGPGFGELSGKSARDISDHLREMRDRNPSESIMDRQAHGYTDQQIQLIAEYLSTKPAN